MAEGSTVGEVLASSNSSTRDCPARSSTSDGHLHRFVNVYLNDDDVRYLSALDTPVGPSDELSILPAVAGGSAGPTEVTGRRDRLRLRPGPHRQHPDGRHQRAEPQPGGAHR